MSSELSCLFCKNDDGITLFNKETFKKCSDVLRVRVAYKFKYNEVILPTTLDGISGYHTTCYKTFTALKRKYIDNFSELVKSQQSTSEYINFYTTFSIINIKKYYIYKSNTRN